MNSIAFNLLLLGFTLAFLCALTLLIIASYRNQFRTGLVAGFTILIIFGLIVSAWRLAQYFLACPGCALEGRVLSTPLTAILVALVGLSGLAILLGRFQPHIFPSYQHSQRKMERTTGWLYVRLLAFTSLLGLVFVASLGQVLERGLTVGWQPLPQPRSGLMDEGYPVEQNDIIVGYPGEPQVTATPYQKPSEHLIHLSGADHEAVVAESNLGRLYTARLADCLAVGRQCWSRYQPMSDPTVVVSLQPSNCEVDFVQLPPPAPAVDTLSVRTCRSFETILSDYMPLSVSRPNKSNGICSRKCSMASNTDVWSRNRRMANSVQPVEMSVMTRVCKYWPLTNVPQ